MSHVSPVFILKPIIDLLHGDALIYVSEIALLKDKIAELEKENKLLREINSTPIKIEKEIKESPTVVIKNIIIDDTVYVKEAETFAEPVNEVVENTEKVNLNKTIKNCVKIKSSTRICGCGCCDTNTNIHHSIV